MRQGFSKLPQWFHDVFPDESTLDQFFDEKQFEAYRELGYSLATKLLGDKESADLIK